MTDDFKNKFTIQYTLYDPTRTQLEKPSHLKFSFESTGDLLAALDEGASALWDDINEKYGKNNQVDLILLAITHDNAKDWYDLLTKEKPHNDATSKTP